MELLRRPRRWLAIVSIAAVIASCVAISALLWSTTTSPQRREAQRRWSARPFASYRIAIRVDFGGAFCAQELETRGEYLRRVLYNNCRPNWLGLTTVARLFEIDAQLDRPQPCYALSQVCSCAQVRQGEVTYDSRLGFPAMIAYRREIRPNFLHADYWRRLFDTRQFPSCGPINQPVRIAVVAITPIQ